MLKSKFGRRAVGLGTVLGVTLIGATTLGLWASAAGPASTDAELVEPAAAVELDAEVDSAAGGEAMACPCSGTSCPCPPCQGRLVLVDNDCNACCWTCNDGEPFCWGG